MESVREPAPEAGVRCNGVMSHRNSVLRFPLVDASAVPWLSVSEMREVDRLMVDVMGIDLLRMMENAGRSTAAVARHLLGGNAGGRRVLVLAGPGGNGGGGLVAARHLHVAGADVGVWVVGSLERLSPATHAQMSILRAIGVSMRHDRPAVGAEPPDLIVDALLGYGQLGAPSEPVRDCIRFAEGRLVLSLDVPSGLELTTGCVHEPTIKAEATVTVAAPKVGLRGDAAPFVGHLYLADISVPPAVWAAVGHGSPSVFGQSAIVQIGH